MGIPQDQDQDQDSLLVKRRNDNHSPGPVIRELVPSSHQRSGRKGGKTIDLYCYIKVLKVKPVYQQMTLSSKLRVVGISTLWHFRLPLPIQMFIKVASSPRLSGIGMPSPIL